MPASTNWSEAPLKPVRLLGADLVLSRDLGGYHGLVERYCAHRRADRTREMLGASASASDFFHAGEPEWVQEAHRAATGVASEPMDMLDL